MKNLTAKSRPIAQAIVFAQIASDGGKWGNPRFDSDDLLIAKSSVSSKKANKCFKRGYSGKDGNILKAIRLIQKSHSEEFHFAVTRNYITDFWGVVKPQYIVYFNFMVDGERQEISFHSFDPALDRYVREDQKVFWRQQYSRTTAAWLARRFGL